MADLISIIIPCYNVEKYVSACINSVLKQSYHNIEVLCVDDCSSDNTKNNILSIITNDSRVKLLCNAYNLGVSATRNNGVSYATGEYLLFLDADDLLAENVLEKLVYTIKLLDADICFGQVQQFSESTYFPVHYNLKGINGIYSYSKMKKYLLGRCYATCCRLYKTDFFISKIQEFPDYTIGEDVVPFIKGQCFAKKLAVIDDVVILYRKHPESSTSKDINYNDINLFLTQTYDVLFCKGDKSYRQDFLFFCANSFNWFVKNDKLKKCFVNVLEQLQYNEKDFKKSAALKRLRNIYGSPYTILDRLRTKINKFRWYYLDK